MCTYNVSLNCDAIVKAASFESLRSGIPRVYHDLADLRNAMKIYHVFLVF